MKVGNVLTISLLVGCGLLAAATGLFMTGWSNELEPLEPASARPLPSSKLDQIEPFAMGDVADYALIGERPLFNDDRRPKPVEIDDNGGGDEGPEQPPVELDVAIGGIIITAETKIALLTDNKTKEHMRVKEGANLDGELADWVLASVEPRKLSFDGGSAGQVELELTVNNKAIKTPPKPVIAAVPAQANGGAEPKSDGAADADRAARAEEIRRRVAARREQLREEAARRRMTREQQKQQDEDQ